MKKKIIIISSFIVFIILCIIFGITMKKLIEKEQEEQKETVVQISEKEVSIFDVGQDDNDNFIVEDVTETIGDIQLNIGDETITDNLGTNIILNQTYCHLKDEYYLIEILVAKREGLEVLSDAELSTNYDYCKSYGKIWYVYNEKTNEKYIFEDNSLMAQLSLNPKITNNEFNIYFEFDKMFYFGGMTDVNHYRIDVNDLISLAQSNSIINFDDFSTINVPNFTKESLVEEVQAFEDLNLDGIKDDIKLELFDDYSDFNKLGFRLTINDCKVEYKNCNTVPAINIIDLDKTDKFKEILIISTSEEEPHIQEWEILSYDGNNISIVFNQNIEDNSLDFPEKINYIDSLTLEDDGFLRLKTTISDSVQNWEIIRKYALNENHILYEIIPKYYLNKKEQKIIALEDIVLYKEMNDNGISDRQIYKGQEVVLEGTTLDYWFVVSIDSEEFYIPLEKNGHIKDLDVSPFEVFKGLDATD